MRATNESERGWPALFATLAALALVVFPLHGGDAGPAASSPAQVEIPLHFNGEALGLVPGVATGRILNGQVEIAARAMSDVHVVSQPLLFARGQRYKISCEARGANLASSSGNMAGGISLRGEKMLIDFPAGSYDWRPFSMVYSPASSASRALTVGIGGWKQGSGELSVRNMRVELLF